MIQDSLVDQCQELDSKVDWKSVNLDDVTRRLELFRSLDRYTHDRVSVSDLPPTSGAAKIATALWAKSHPGAPDFDRLFELAGDDIPIVRLAAVDALSDLVDGTGNGEPQSPIPSRARRLLDARREAEPVPLIRLQLHDISQKLGRLVRTAPGRSAPLRKNPYTAGLPIRDRKAFFGRDELLAQSAAILSRPGVSGLVLHGARRAGKTSFLYQIAEGALGDDWIPVYVDLQQVAGGQLGDLMLIIEQELVASFSHFIPSGQTRERAENHPFMDWLRDAIDAAHPRSVVLLLDEYEVLAEFVRDRDVARQFQAVFEELPQLRWVFAGSRRVEQLDVPGFLFLLDVCQTLAISVLSSEATRQLIRRPAEGVLSYSSEAVEQIVRLTGGHPFYTQLLCQLIFEQARDGATASLPDVESATEQFLRSPSPHLLLTWNACPFPARIVATALAETSGPGDDWVGPRQVTSYLRSERYPVRFTIGEIREAIGILRELDWVQKRTGEDTCRFTIGLIRRWVAECRPIWEQLQPFREGKFAQAAFVPVQSGAWIIDIVALVVLGLVTFLLGMLWRPLLLVGGLVTGVLLWLSVWWNGGTPGMRVLNIRAVPVGGGPISRPRALAVAAIDVARFTLYVAAIVTTISLADEHDDVVAVLPLLLVGALEVCDLLVARGDPRKRGIWSRLTRITLVRDQAVQRGGHHDRVPAEPIHEPQRGPLPE